MSYCVFILSLLFLQQSFEKHQQHKQILLNYLCTILRHATPSVKYVKHMSKSTLWFSHSKYERKPNWKYFTDKVQLTTSKAILKFLSQFSQTSCAKSHQVVISYSRICLWCLHMQQTHMVFNKTMYRWMSVEKWSRKVVSLHTWKFWIALLLQSNGFLINVSTHTLTHTRPYQFFKKQQLCWRDTSSLKSSSFCWSPCIVSPIDVIDFHGEATHSWFFFLDFIRSHINWVCLNTALCLVTEQTNAEFTNSMHNVCDTMKSLKRPEHRLVAVEF